MDKEELKENIEKSTTEDTQFNTQSTENGDEVKKSEDENLEAEKKEEKKITPEEELEILKDKLART
jgi:hypothetical protein